MELKYFSWIREGVGKAEEALAKPSDVNTVADLLDFLCKTDEAYKAVLTERVFVRVAVNQVHVQHDHTLTDEDEVAIFPPVTGG